MNLHLKALLSRYVAQRDEALANLNTIFEGAVVVPQAKQDRWVRQLVEAEAAMGVLHRNFDSFGVVHEQPGEALGRLVFDNPTLALAVMDELNETIEAVTEEDYYDDDDDIDAIIDEVERRRELEKQTPSPENPR